MTTSQNGWPASRALRTRPLTVDGVTVFIADNDDIETVFRYLITQYAYRVEPLRSGQCGCYSYRPNVNNPSELSNHSSATALDLNSLEHRNGADVHATFTQAQIDAVHAILASVPELADLIHWGGDWFRSNGLTPDGMHFELHSHDLPLLARVVERIREQEDIVTEDDIAKIAAAVAALLDSEKVDRDGKVSVRQALNQARNDAAKAAAK